MLFQHNGLFYDGNSLTAFKETETTFHFLFTDQINKHENIQNKISFRNSSQTRDTENLISLYQT